MREWSQKHIEELIKKHAVGGSGGYTEVIPLTVATDLLINKENTTSQSEISQRAHIELAGYDYGLLFCHVHYPYLYYLVDTFAGDDDYHTFVRPSIAGALDQFCPVEFSYRMSQINDYGQVPANPMFIYETGYTNNGNSLNTRLDLSLPNTGNFSCDIIFKDHFDELTAIEKSQHYCATDFLLVR